MSNLPQSTFTIHCAGCYKEVTNPYTGAWDFEYKIEQMISKEGWIRRDFGPNARLWFCSPPCAFESNAAIQCEDWWRQHNAANRLKLNTRIFVATMVAMVLLVFAAFGFHFGR